MASPLASPAAGRETSLPAALRDQNTKIVKKPLEGLQTAKGLTFSHILDFSDVCGVYGAFWMTFRPLTTRINMNLSFKAKKVAPN